MSRNSQSSQQSRLLDTNSFDEKLEMSSNLSFSMDIDPNTHTNVRTYPSVVDYYRANVKDPNKPPQLQSGLSNYSALKLGDDRISFSESILSATYRIPVEHKMAINAPRSINKILL